MVKLQIDSGADLPVWPLDLHPEYPTFENEASRLGTCYAAAGDLDGGTLKDLGSRAYRLRFGGSDKPIDRVAEVHVVEVNKPLMSLAHLNVCGHDFHAMADGRCWLYHAGRDETIEVRKDGPKFFLDAEVVPYDPFPRRPTA